MLIHVDMSNKFYLKKGNVGVAWLCQYQKEHKGLALSRTLIKQLKNQVNADYDFPRLYAISIYLIIKEDIKRVSKIVICEDEPFVEVEGYLKLLLNGIADPDLKIVSLFRYREELNRKIKSPADKLANAYRKRALKPKQWHKGTKLNVVKTTYKEILKLWNFLEKKDLSG